MNAAPDTTFYVDAARGIPVTNTYMLQFPYDTYVTLEAIGTVYLNAKPKLPNASPNYIWPSRAVAATGQVDNHTDGVCAMGISFSDGYGALPSFGICGATPKIDTVLSRGNVRPWINRGPLPVKHFYECSNTSDICHYINDGGDGSFVRERPIPITLKLSVTPATLDTAAPSPHTFQGIIAPDSITMNGVKGPHPYHVTLWQWIGADRTRDSVLTGSGKGPGCTIVPQTLLCVYRPPESGKMILKAFVGGWEQTASVSVQCVAAPADSLLNDSTSDYAVRSKLLTALDSSNVDSLPGKGYDPLTGHGYKQEKGGDVFKMNDSSYKAFIQPSFDGIGTECAYSPDPNPSLPSGAVRRAAIFHTHPTEYDKPVFGCPDKNGQRMAQSPADTLPTANPRLPYGRSRIGTNGGGSDDDWASADSLHVPVFVVEKGGRVWRLDPGVPKNQRRNNPYHWQATGNKCQWVR